MLSASSSGCINHPGVEAVIRCKQCGRPVCGACVETGPTGRFCSTACRDKHQAFVLRAQQADGRASSGFLTKIKKLVVWLIIAAAVCVALGVVGTVFQVPVLSELVFRARGIIGI